MSPDTPAVGTTVVSWGPLGACSQPAQAAFGDIWVLFAQHLLLDKIPSPKPLAPPTERALYWWCLRRLSDWV